MRRSFPVPAAAGALLALVAVFYRGLIFDRLVIGDYDAFVYFYPLREYAASVLRQGGFPLWNPYTFLGAPFFANIQTAVLYPPNLVFALLPTPYAFSVSVVGHVLLAGAGMYLFCRRTLGVSSAPALLGAVAFSLGGFISFQVSHINQLAVSAWLPLLLAAFDEANRRRNLKAALLVGAIGTLQLLAGHTQEWYFSTACLGLFALWRAVLPGIARTSGVSDRSDRADRSDAPSPRRTYLAARLFPLGVLAVTGAAEAGLAAIQWVPTAELSGESIRGGGLHYGEAVSFSLPPTSALYTLLPTYPSTLFSEYVGYVGIIPIVLAVLGVAFWTRRPVALFMAALVAVGLVLAFGGYNPLAPLIYRVVPGMDFFRVPARWLLVYTLGVSGLAALGAQCILDGVAGTIRLRAPDDRTEPGGRARRRKALRNFTVSAVLLGSAAGGIGLFGLLATPRPTPGVVLPWFGIAASAILLCAVGVRVPSARSACLALLVAGTAVELWLAGGNAVYRHPVPAEGFLPQRASTSYLLDRLRADGAPSRVLSVATDNYEVKETPDYKQRYGWLDETALNQFLVDVKLSETLAPNIPMEYRIQSPDGYDGGVLPLRRYAALKALLVPPAGAAPDSLLRNNLAYVPPDRALDLLGVGYVLGSKVKDASVENVYYDRGLGAELTQGSVRTLRRVTDIQATSVGIISSTLGARGLKDGTAVGSVRVTTDSGATYELPLRVGQETAETTSQDGTLGPPDHRRPMQVEAWPSGTPDTDYFVKLRLPSRARVKEVSLLGAQRDVTLRVRAVTLIDDEAALIAPLTLSDRLDRELYFDTKVYTVRDPLPRAYVVYNSAVRDDEVALSDLKRGDTPLREAVLLAPSSTARSVFRASGPGFRPEDVRILSYAPEEVVMEATAREDGYIVLMDSFYPGWVARVDGREVPIERANYHFRAVPLEKGQHQVVFRYEPGSFETGKLVTLGSVLVIAAALLGPAVRLPGRRRVL